MLEIPKLTERAGWYGKDLDRSGAWVRTLDDTQREEIDAALARVQRARLPLFGFGRDDFPLPTTAIAAGRDRRRTGERTWRGAPARSAGRAILGRRHPPDLLGAGLPPRHRRVPERPRRDHGRGARRDQAARQDLCAHRARQDHVVARPRPLHRTAALAHRPLRRHRAALRAQRQGRRDQQAHQHRDDLQRDPPPPPRPAGAAVPGLLACSPDGRGWIDAGTGVRAAGVRRAGRQADLPVFPHLCRAGAGISRGAATDRGAERGARPAGRGGGGGVPVLRRSCPATSSC